LVDDWKSPVALRVREGHSRVSIIVESIGQKWTNVFRRGLLGELDLPVAGLVTGLPPPTDVRPSPMRSAVE